MNRLLQSDGAPLLGPEHRQVGQAFSTAFLVAASALFFSMSASAAFRSASTFCAGLAPHLDRLPELLESQRAIAASLEAADCLLAGAMDWPHRDPFDRLLIATASRRRIPIVSADVVFDGLVARIW